MVKLVGRSGQLSLGKKHAGQYYDVEHLPEGAILLRPVSFAPPKEIDREALEALLGKDIRQP